MRCCILLGAWTPPALDLPDAPLGALARALILGARGEPDETAAAGLPAETRGIYAVARSEAAEAEAARAALSAARAEAGRRGGLAKAAGKKKAAKPKKKAKAAPAPVPDVPEEKLNPLEAHMRDAFGMDAEARAAFWKFWRAYPRREFPREAAGLYVKAVRGGASPEAIEAGARAYAEAMAAEGRPRHMISLPTHWLKAGGWEGEIEMPAEPPAPSSGRRMQAGAGGFGAAIAAAVAARESGHGQS